MNTSYYKVKWKKWFYQDMPTAASGLEWHEWKVNAKKNNIRWFLADTLPTWVASTFIWPVERKRDLLIMRFVRKMWRIDIPTLDKYEYHENDEQLLHCVFYIITRFVEQEKAWMQHISKSWDDLENDDDDAFMKTVTRARRDKKTWKNANKRDYGLTYLDWEISLDNEGGQSQSHTAKEIKELYLWWNDIRPARTDTMDVQGDKGVSWSEHCVLDTPKYDKEGNELDFLARMEVERDDDKLISDSASKAMHDAEEEYNKEDEEMLIRLVKIRNGLWT